MRNLFTLLFLLAAGNIYAQKKNNLDAYFSFQYNGTVYDRTQSSNSSGIGFGIETVLNPAKRLHPVLQLNGNFFAGTKVFYTTTDGRPIYSKEAMSTVLGGLRINLGEKAFSFLTTGAAFYNDAVHLGFRPGIGFYTSDKKKFFLQSSFTHIFQKDEISNEPFGFLSIAMALKVF